MPWNSWPQRLDVEHEQQVADRGTSAPKIAPIRRLSR
jgi:hypothetical protein